jgi:hypothetical protein
MTAWSLGRASALQNYQNTIARNWLENRLSDANPKISRRLKSETFGFFDAWQFLHFFQQIFRDGTIHFDERDGRAAPKIPAEREGCDIDAGIA